MPKKYENATKITIRIEKSVLKKIDEVAPDNRTAWLNRVIDKALKRGLK